ncbi:hypothetical protein [Haloferax volcanii]|uniref:Uncharacterized protein n=1 Tax=Haloferax volcanii TaxID=2246 RepID=A0A558FF38_HALVO|nr:hypothetical protein [Haloferax volcanii]TVT84125.1 hypothetical protein FQA18_19910 [Haloferax volcanii]
MYELTYGRARLGLFDTLEEAQTEKNEYESKENVRSELLNIWGYEPPEQDGAEISMGLDGLSIEDINNALIDE